MRMPFGKYRYWDVEDIPRDYLEWLYENVDLRDRLRRAVEDVLFWRGGTFTPAPPPPDPDEGVVKAVYRELARKWHPDRGGSNEAMAALNEFYHLLKERTS